MCVIARVISYSVSPTVLSTAPLHTTELLCTFYVNIAVFYHNVTMIHSF